MDFSMRSIPLEEVGSLFPSCNKWLGIDGNFEAAMSIHIVPWMK
jgi:hypothetical protein